MRSKVYIGLMTLSYETEYFLAYNFFDIHSHSIICTSLQFKKLIALIMGKLKLEWVRPESIPYPQIWSTFMAKDLNSASLVEYQIQDLPESRFDEAITHMEINYLKGEPITKSFGGSNDSDHADDYKMIWRTILSQKTVLFCVKVDSDEMVGVNMNFVTTKNDTFSSDAFDNCKSEITKDVMITMKFLYKDFDVFQRYGVNEYLTSFGLSVDERFRGRRIGEKLLSARRGFCKAFGLTLTQTSFSSKISNQIADKVGFIKDVGYSYDQLTAFNPDIRFPNIESKEFTLKSWNFSN